jgi:hypothetical protein
LGDVQALKNSIESAGEEKGADLRRQVLKVLEHAGADVGAVEFDLATSASDASE